MEIDQADRHGDVNKSCIAVGVSRSSSRSRVAEDDGEDPEPAVQTPNQGPANDRVRG